VFLVVVIQVDTNVNSILVPGEKRGHTSHV